MGNQLGVPVHEVVDVSISNGPFFPVSGDWDG